MPRSLPLAPLVALLLCAPGASGQALDDDVVPRGRVRVSVNPIFTSWGSRFGEDASGARVREDLGDDLTAASALDLFPGAETLRASIATLTAMRDYAPVLGSTDARVTKDVTRVEFGAHLGVFDWLTVGAVLPWTRTRTSVDVQFRSDTLASDLGMSPTLTDPAAVSAFLSGLGAAESAARASADQTCAASPGSPECASALALADRASAFLQSATGAYGATPFFPHAGTATAAALSAASTSLDTDLAAAGLPAIGAPMPFATAWVLESDFATLPTGPGVGASALRDVRGLWHAGDVEVSLTARLLQGASRPAEPRPPGAPFQAPGLSYRVLLTLLARLPTGVTDDPDTLLDVGTGDGQTDLEARLLGDVSLGSRLSLRAAARYGIQRPRTLVRRVVPHEVVLAGVDTRQLVEWTPGSYVGVEASTAFHFSDDLSVGAEYRLFRKQSDTYELAGPSVGAPY
ncbi:MAG TPA: hypothetical protein VFQ22_04885, partial [Longimicrobiales bacterium]|nr:hypothetical protein [Longimicrobiales bacterium]